MQGCPSWDGNSTKFNDWKVALEIWAHSQDLSKKRSFAALVATRLTADAKEATLNWETADWFPWGDQSEATSGPSRGAAATRDDAAYIEMNRRGIENLVKHLQNTLCKKPHIQKGERLAEFFETNKFRRKRGMSMHNYILQ